MKSNAINVMMALFVAVVFGLLGCGSGGDSNSAISNNDISTVINKSVSNYNSLMSSGTEQGIAINETVNWLKSQKGVSNAYPAADNRNIFIKDTNGMTTLFITETFSNISSSVTKKVLYKNTDNKKALNSQKTSQGMQSIVLDPFSLPHKNSSVVSKLFSNSPNMKVTYLKGADVTPDTIHNLSGNDLIYYIGHGGIDKSNRDTIFIGTGVPFSEDSITAYAAKYGGNKYAYFGRMITTDNRAYVLVNSYFVADYSKNINATAVYVDACHSLDADTNDTMANAFIKNGAKSYVGWDGSTAPWLLGDKTYKVAESFFADILACKSVSTAFNNLPFDWNLSSVRYRGDGILSSCSVSHDGDFLAKHKSLGNIDTSSCYGCHGRVNNSAFSPFTDQVCWQCHR